MPQKSKQKSARDYRHDDKKALLRPEGGAQDVFPPARKKPPKTCRYDSSLSPELAWDEAEARSEGERLIGAILRSDNLEAAQTAARELQNLSRPFLNWAGKAERGRIQIPTLPLFTHERLSTQAVLETLKRRHRKRGQTLDLFGEGDKSIGEKIRGAYQHLNGWQNRLILGDSLQVMNSLLEYESLGGQVQMVYMDPPYGVKFGGNFQPFVRKRDVKDGDDDSLSREPEMVQAYRDTWELGIHSWLTYMRDRLLLARELLTDSGSCFVQISDENVHLVRSVMDEVFGTENFLAQISFAKTSGYATNFLTGVCDYILWYGKDHKATKYHQLYTDKIAGQSGATKYNHITLNDGSTRTLLPEERSGEAAIPAGARFWVDDNLTSQGNSLISFKYNGREYKGTYKTTTKGLERLASANRLYAARGTLRYIRYIDDFPAVAHNTAWMDIGGVQSRSDPKIYVVQTATEAIKRCILMTTDPGDLVFDPTCGSGTTAIAAEQWGRRWITTDVSRVPLALARQRLLTATYPYYQLKTKNAAPVAVLSTHANKTKKASKSAASCRISH